jgi:hypothetical protein
MDLPNVAELPAIREPTKEPPNYFRLALSPELSDEDRGHCQEFCVWGRVDHHALTNRSSNMMANWVFASHHSRGGIFHVPATWRKTR